VIYLNKKDFHIMLHGHHPSLKPDNVVINMISALSP
jgi:hypothetical protein